MCWISMNDVIVQNPIDSSRFPIKVASQWRGKSVSLSFSLLSFSAPLVCSLTHSYYRINLPYPSLLLLSWSKSKVPHLVPPLFNSCAQCETYKLRFLRCHLVSSSKPQEERWSEEESLSSSPLPFCIVSVLCFLFSIFRFLTCFLLACSRAVRPYYGAILYTHRVHWVCVADVLAPPSPHTPWYPRYTSSSLHWANRC